MSTQSPAASSHGDRPVPDPVATIDRAPRLGEFSQLMNSARSVLSTYVTATSGSQSHLGGESERDPPAIETKTQSHPSKLGDFQKVRERFQLPEQSPNTQLEINSPFSELATQASGSLPLLATPLPCHTRRSKRILSRSKRLSDSLSQHPEPLGNIIADSSSPELDITSESDQYSDTRRSALTPASTPPTPRPKWPFSEPRQPGSKKREPWSPTTTTTTTKAPRESSNEQPSVLFSYNNGKGYLPVQVYGRVLSQAEKHRALLLRLSLHRAVDATVAEQFPSIYTQGTHVFIDMSNIEINFLQALKARHSLRDRAYPMPRTHLDLELLTEILVRGRPTVTQRVGCSVVPGRPRPWYVSQLKRLGYHVDLRQRKPVPAQDPGASPLGVRYVEDLVDETLQTRIAEAVMEYFDRQGTIVLATGDAKPAEYSAGFFKYVERALRMGWNVELASWKSSLSATWTSHKLKAQWGNKFRVIELDSFLDLLLANEA